jgi:outer membrane biosynthesis protein TonB
MNANEGDKGPISMEDATPEEIMSAVFANMVIQNTNMALMFLGKVPHPQTGQPIKDLESAQMFIDQLEMLAYKTRGNLDDQEKQLISQNLVALRMAFVEELRKAGIPVPEHLTESPTPPAPAQSPAPKPEPTPTPAPQPTPAPAATTPPPTPQPAEEESRKRFTKKY